MEILRDYHSQRLSGGGLFQFSRTLQNMQYELLSYNGTISCTLAHLCCKVIVSDGYFTKQSLQYLPRNMYKLLMSVALMNGRDRAMQILLTVWPWETLKLSDLISPFLDSINLIYDRDKYCKWLQDSFFITSSLINGFISCLSTDSRLSLANLKMLDLGGFPTDDTVIFKVAKIILSSCEDFEKSCQLKDRKHVKLGSTCGTSAGNYLLKLDMNSLHEEITSDTALYTIKVDTSIHSGETFQTLSHLFTSKSIAYSPLKLHFSKIDLSYCSGSKNIMQLLNSAELQSMPLRGLSLSCNHLTNGGVFETLIISVLPFRYIQSLDLSYNRINLSYNATLLETFTNALSSLNHLRRLNLSNNKLTDCLTTILSKISNFYLHRQSECISSSRRQRKRKFPMEELSYGLEYLNISACRLCERDITYLSRSHHISTLKELDISQNNMHLFLKSMAELLTAVRPTIYALDMEKCYFNEKQLCDLLPEFAGFLNLKYLNYAGYQLNSEDTYYHLVNFINLPALVLVRLSYPINCCEDYRLNTYNASINVNEQGKLFNEKCQQLLCSEQFQERRLNVIWD